MIRIHRAGRVPITYVLVFLVLLNGIIFRLAPQMTPGFLLPSLAFILLVLYFFRNPKRNLRKEIQGMIYSPADGKIVGITDVLEDEYLKEECVRVSIFLSIFNVHVNRHPVNGEVLYTRHHPGRFLAAWREKASWSNERNTIVYQTGSHRVLVRQITGAIARRIECYCNEGDLVATGGEMGFIRFGSRVDVFLPRNAEIRVQEGTHVKGGVTMIARLVAR